MKTKYTLLMMLLAIAVSAAPAAAQQPGRRNATVTSRQESKAEKQQQKVDKVQKPTNIVNQPATDRKVREAEKGNKPSNGSGSHSGMTPPPSGGNHNPGGNHNHGGFTPPPGGHSHNGHNGPGARPDHGKRPPVAPRKEYNRTQIYERTNASTIVVGTTFRTKKEAYDYIEWLLSERYYTMGSYGNNYNWIQSDIAYIPTPFDWTNPMTHNQFRMKFHISGSGLGGVKVQITAEWRESVIDAGFVKLRFQPSDSYSTYYAWNVLEDIADNIPHWTISYK